MNFDWSPAQRELYDGVTDFVSARLNPLLGSSDGVATHDAWRACGEFGLTGLCAPLDLGGLGLDALTTAFVVEGLGRRCPNMGFCFSLCAHLFAVLRPVTRFLGSDLVRQTARRLASGEWIGANAISEAEAGSDVFALRARAERCPDGYRLQGAKTYVTNAPLADVFLVYAKTNPDHGYLGLSAFVVPRQTRGLVVGQPFDKMGLSGSPMASLYLDDCVVPREALVGAEGQGAEVFKHSMLWERSCLFASYVGQMERQLDDVVSHARERRQFGKPIARHQAVSHRLVDMKLRLEAARGLLYRACAALDAGSRDAEPLVAMAKLAISEAAIQSGLDAIQLHGGAGYLRETGIEQGLRDAIPTTIFSGTSEIQRNTIARWLGL